MFVVSPASGSKHFGDSLVIGSSRVPWPALRIMAFIVYFFQFI